MKGRPYNDRWFTWWMAFVAILGFLFAIGSIALVVYLLPHIIDMIDRVGQ